MAITVNTNIASLNAQRNLQGSQNVLNKSLARLSSGLRINSARDDAAGLAISDRMTSQIRGLNQAVRNANDGISVAQTAEGALQESTSILQRVRELAIQSSNASNSSVDRQSLNQEVSDLIAEFDRIASQTEFNGVKILTGSFSGNFQIGASVGQTIAVSIGDLRSTAVGTSTTYSAVTARTDTAFATGLRDQYAGVFDGSTTINGSSVTAVSANSLAQEKVDAINAVSGSTGVKAFTYGNSAVGTNATADGTAWTKGDLVINGVSIDAPGAATVAAAVTAINNATSSTGVTADAAAAGTMVLSNKTGEAISVEVSGANAAGLTGFTAGTHNISAGSNGQIVLSQGLGSASVTLGQAADAAAMGYASGTTIATTDQQLTGMDVATVNNAALTILAVDNSIASIDSARADLGAAQNRFDHTIANLQSVSENVSAARSRIVDADFAAETANMTKAQILQQAGLAMLAQANTIPQAALTLLKG